MRVFFGKWMAYKGMSMNGRNLHCCSAISTGVQGAVVIGAYALIDEIIDGPIAVLKEYSTAERAEEDFKKIHRRALEVNLEVALPEFDLPDAELYAAEGFGTF